MEGAKSVNPKTLEAKELDVKMLSGRSDEDVLGRMREKLRDLTADSADPLSKL